MAQGCNRRGHPEQRPGLGEQVGKGVHFKRSSRRPVLELVSLSLEHEVWDRGAAGKPGMWPKHSGKGE